MFGQSDAQKVLRTAHIAMLIRLLMNQSRLSRHPLSSHFWLKTGITQQWANKSVIG
jgi:hypothetical protein